MTCPHPETCNQGRCCTCKPSAEMACHHPNDEPPTRGEQAIVAILLAASAALACAMLGWLWRTVAGWIG